MSNKTDRNDTRVVKASKQLFKPAFGVLVDGSNPDDGAIPRWIRATAPKPKAE